LPQIKDPNIALETVTSGQAYLATPRPKRATTTKETAVKSKPKPEKQTLKLDTAILATELITSSLIEYLKALRKEEE
jgi:hypothetical protein